MNKQPLIISTPALLLLLLGLGVHLLAGPLQCQAGPGNRAVILQLAWKHQFQFAGYYAALSQGYYQEAGLEVRLREGGEGRFAREAVLSGQAQYGVAGAELVLHRIEGEPFVVLAPIFQHSPSIPLTRADSGLDHPQDLIGRRVMLLPGKGAQGGTGSGHPPGAGTEL